MEITTHSTQETKEFANKIAKGISLGMIIALYGDLGSGKTTFTRFLVEALGEKGRVQSPTFVIARKYGHINHVDLYRLSTEQEVEDLGFKDMVEDKESITIVEWPDLAEKLLPKDTLRIYFEYIDESSRRIKL
ncbi:tRNA (adenosine(37)-N6)-threonylcarbamoyltransferase complex ATPase subunit type 1 TsaE [candidate division WWE3 bacterium]|uniref:tRNA threonylcarbamoyladenosine biosynthesis protein TsaE n=1 Tax=candidate division WWE3 bacterium TaxID=2053526 RepID=A0A7X9E6E3_UNCKA|nr:tRNA (adenosine(37)-N6)-threonylcarbamoyltransferase complex ATPase subunit type 1 TsaE [candidate division WWE3 bacterium]